MKKLIYSFLLLFPTVLIFAQEATAPADTSYWKVGGVTTLTFAQVSLTNWASGGQNSISINGYFNLFANYNKGKINWKNNLEMGYGLIRQGEVGRLQKTDDIIIATTQFGYKIKDEVLLWSTLMDFRTQFYRGTDATGNEISKWMAPGYLLVATGLDWKPNTNFSLTYAPATGKFTFVLDQALADAGAFGVDKGTIDPLNPTITIPGSRVRAELGSFLRMTYTKDNLITNVNYQTKLELFSNYLVNFPEVDINWQNLMTMKINSLLSVNWQTQLIYDKDIEFREIDEFGTEIVTNKVQFKSVFGVGLAYNFGAKK
jgi:hypothetical protein